MAQLLAGASVNVYYESGSGGVNQAMGTVVSTGPDFLELTNSSGNDVSIGWARIIQAIS
jgi:hypothetical protein